MHATRTELDTLPVLLNPKPARKRMSTSVVDRVLEICRESDPSAKLASATYTQDRSTLIRIRSDATGSMVTLRDALNERMPLTSVDVIDSALDGTCEISITVPTGAGEKETAWHMVGNRTGFKLFYNVGIILIVAGIGAWLADITSITQTDLQEL